MESGMHAVGLAARRWPLVAQPVVEPAEQPPVLLGGRAPRRIRLDVVGLTRLGRLVAVGMGADPVP